MNRENNYNDYRLIRKSRIKRNAKKFYKQLKNGVSLFHIKNFKNIYKWLFSLKGILFFSLFVTLFLFGLLIVTSNSNAKHRFTKKQISYFLTPDITLSETIDNYIEFQTYTTLVAASKEKKESVLEGLEVTQYVVAQGETLGAIARKFNLALGTLISFNNINDVRKVKVGSELRIPSTNGILYTVVRGDSIEGISRRFKADFNKICDYNDISSDVIQIGQKLFLPGVALDEYSIDKALGRLFINPTRGRISSPFGYRIDPFTGLRAMHNGIDIANAIGTPVVASMSGKVIYVDNRPKGYGNMVIIKHNDGYQTLYAHLNTIVVTQGAWVNQGVKIGTMGSTGRSTGSHLHFSIFKNNTPQNPANYVHF